MPSARSLRRSGGCSGELGTDTPKSAASEDRSAVARRPEQRRSSSYCPVSQFLVGLLSTFIGVVFALSLDRLVRRRDERRRERRLVQTVIDDLQRRRALGPGQ